jgi:hypothetical protein
MSNHMHSLSKKRINVLIRTNFSNSLMLQEIKLIFTFVNDELNVKFLPSPG